MNEMYKKDIEIDVDGVLADMDGNYTPYIIDIIPDFTEEKYITGWSMPLVAEKYPEAFKRVQNLWVNPDFIYSLPKFEKVIEGMKELGLFYKDKGQITVHTHLFDGGPVYESRYRWLEELREESNVDFNINISVGEHKKTLETTKILIEDSVRNLQKSNADYKFLIRRCHNRDFTEKDLGKSKESFVVASFYDAVQKIKSIKF
jgi:5'(3')-deoxyribonucleotidase